MISKEYDRVAPWKRELLRKIGLFGLSDLRKIAPIGDLGYANGWESFYGKGWMHGGMEKAILREFHRQGFEFDKGWSTGYRQTDHHSLCTELAMSYSVDSGD